MTLSSITTLAFLLTVEPLPYGDIINISEPYSLVTESEKVFECQSSDELPLENQNGEMQCLPVIKMETLLPAYQP